MVQSMTEIDELRAQVAALTERLSALEGTRPAAAASGITEEEVIAIAAAVAAYFGVRVHIKAIRLVSSRAWAQEGRVSIQASHRLHG